EWNIFYFIFFVFPWLIFTWHRYGITRTSLHDISLVHFLFFLNTRWKIQTTSGTLIWLYRTNQYPISNNNQLLQFILRCYFHCHFLICYLSKLRNASLTVIKISCPKIYLGH